MAKAPVLKTGGRKPLQVRILCPPLDLARDAITLRLPLGSGMEKSWTNRSSPFANCFRSSSDMDFQSA